MSSSTLAAVFSVGASRGFLPGALVRSRLVALLVAFLLLTAGTLKGVDITFTPVPQAGALPSWLVLVLAEIELGLGCWLIVGRGLRGAWAIAIVLFAGMACYSLGLAVAGETASCGCFGRLPVSPWSALVIDCAVLAGMIAFAPWRRQPRPALEGQGPAPVAPAPWVFGAVCLLGGLFALAYAYPGRFPLLLARLSGNTVVADPAFIFAGEAEPGLRREVALTVRNYGQSAVTITGGNSTCSCISGYDLPVRLSPNEQRSVRILLTFSRKDETFAHRVTLFTDSPDQTVVNAWVWGRSRS